MDDGAQATDGRVQAKNAVGRNAPLASGQRLATSVVNDGLSGVTQALVMLVVKCTGTIGPDSFVLDSNGYLKLPDGFQCTRPEAVGQDIEGNIRSYLSLQYPRPETEPGVPESRLVIPNAKEGIAGRWAAWKEAFARTGMTHSECPTWTEIETLRTAPQEQTAELAKVRALASVGDDDTKATFEPIDAPTNLELFRSITDFKVAFGRVTPEHACQKEGPAACAAICAGAYPGFVIEAKGSEVRTDPMEWLSDTVYDVILNPYLANGYYHPMWSYGANFGSRWRANNCGAMGRLRQQCDIRVEGFGPAANQGRACSYNESAICPADNCPSEICSIQISSTTFQKVRLRLNCLGSLDAETPGTPGWQAVWDTCISHCYLPP